MKPRNLAFSGFAAALVAASVSAQTPISGNVFDGSGGPLLSGVVYHAVGNLVVPAGQTLTVQPGAIVKFDRATFTVGGTLLAEGTAQSPIIFTSVSDDSAGGDTNGDGSATTGAMNQWYGVSCGETADASRFRHASIRFTGVGGWRGLRLDRCDALVQDCELRDGGNGGLLIDSTSRPAVSRCRFTRQAGSPAAAGLALAALEGFADNVATDCSGGNYLRVDVAQTATDVSLGTRNVIGNTLVFAGNLRIDALGSLTLGAGMIIKPTGRATLTLDGPLTCNGTAGRPVVFTSFQDDSVGGDTNGDGAATVAAPNQLYGLRFNSGSAASQLAFTEIRCAGVGGWDGVACFGADITMTDCAIRDCGSGGVRVDPASRPTIQRCAATGVLGEPAFFGMSILAVPGFQDNTARNCPGGSYLRVDSATCSADTTVQPRNLPGGVMAFRGNLDVSAGVTLTLDAGVVVKPTGRATITFAGTLDGRGTAAEPVVFTSWQDDSFGGDTNGDGGATAAQPNQWYGLRFNTTSIGSRLEHVVVRGSGVGGWPGIDLYTDAELYGCELRDAGRGGLRVQPSNRPIVEDCKFLDIVGGPAVRGVHWEAVAGFLDNEAARCPDGAHIWISGDTVSAGATVDRRNQINGAFVFEGNLYVAAGGQLIINAGVAVKALGRATASVDGELRVRGLVVFTGFADDAFGGDSNGDGNNTQPGANEWYGLRINAGATGVLDSVLIRYAGVGGWQGVDCASTNFSLLRCRAEFCGSGGMRIRDAAVAEQLVAYGNVGYGLDLATNLTVHRSTSAYNSLDGFRLQSGNAGSVSGSISYGNGGQAFSGYAVGDVNYCSGDNIAGGVGNRSGDPLFRNAALGDLRLQSGSPCVDVGPPAFGALGIDFFGDPRVSDGNLDGLPRVDLGAYEFSHVRLSVNGAATPGSTLTLTLESTPSILTGGLVIGIGLQNPVPLLNLGPLFVDLNGPSTAFLVTPNSSTPLSIPAAVQVPFTITVQGLGLALPFPRGNMSNPARVLIDD